MGPSRLTTQDARSRIHLRRHLSTSLGALACGTLCFLIATVKANVKKLLHELEFANMAEDGLAAVFFNMVLVVYYSGIAFSIVTLIVYLRDTFK